MSLLKATRLRAMLLLLAFALNQWPGSAQPSNGLPASPPQYKFRVLVRTGDMVDGRVITSFVAGPGANVVLNDQGQVAYRALTDKGSAIFRDNKLVAEVGMAQSGDQIAELWPPTLSSNGRIAYEVTYSSHPSDRCLACDGKCVLRPDMPISALGKHIDKIDDEYYFDSDDHLWVAVAPDIGKEVVLLDGRYSPEQTKSYDGTFLLGIRGSEGRFIYIGSRFEPRWLMKQGAITFPLNSASFAMNKRGMIFATSQIASWRFGLHDDLYVFPYSAPTVKEDGPGRDPHLFDGFRIMNAFDDIAKTLEPATWQTMYISAVFSDGARCESHRGLGADINNNDEIAFYVEYRASSGALKQALIIGTPIHPHP